MSAAIFRCPGIWTAFSERSFPWEHTRIWCASLYKGRERRPPGGWYKSTSLCCQCAPTHGDLSDLLERVWVLETLPASPGSWDGDHSTDYGQGGWPLMTAPQTLRDASVANVMRRQGAPSTGPWDKKQGFLHMSKARRHRRVTLIMRSGFPLGNNPVVFSHHCRGLMYSKPKCITLDAADIRHSSFWNSLTVSDRLFLTLLTDVRIDSIRAGDIHACIMVESHTMPR